jgi:Respiratory-chain NADH dehydrogenase, 30 Kd subunit
VRDGRRALLRPDGRAVATHGAARGRLVEGHRPWPRAAVDDEIWRFAAGKVAEGTWVLVGLWGDAEAVHMALLDEGDATIAAITLECSERRYPSVGHAHPPAIRLERALRDLCGLEPEGAPDRRPWLDHGRWPARHPLGTNEPGSSTPGPYAFLPREGESLHQIPVDPVHAGIIEPGHFRFTANGETVVRLEERLGYVHKGIESLMAGAPMDAASRLAGHVSGDSTLAYSLVFARAVEAAVDLEAPPRAIWLRALSAEQCERVARRKFAVASLAQHSAPTVPW